MCVTLPVFDDFLCPERRAVKTYYQETFLLILRATRGFCGPEQTRRDFPGLGGLTHECTQVDQDNGGWNVHQLTFASSSNSGGSCGELTANQQLTANQSLASCNGGYTLIMQGDGNLVLYQGGTALWASNTAGSAADEAIMQGDGNLVLYTSSGTPVWASNTAGNAGAYLEVQNDGNVVIYSASGSTLWSTGTAGK